MVVVSKGLPGTYQLNNAYPNPFNPTTTIGFSIPRSDFVKVRIYDVAGRKLATVVNGNMKSGQHSVKWNGKNQASGIYFIQMVCSSFSKFEETKSVLLIK